MIYELCRVVAAPNILYILRSSEYFSAAVFKISTHPELDYRSFVISGEQRLIQKI